MIWLGVIHMKNRLKEVRLSTGMTQEDFAESVGVSKTTYNNYETGRREPRSDFWMAVSDKYNITVDYLIGRSDDPRGTKGKPPANTLVVTNDEIALVKNYRLCTKESQSAIQQIAARIALADAPSIPEEPENLDELILQGLGEFLDSQDLPVSSPVKKEA